MTQLTILHVFFHEFASHMPAFESRCELTIILTYILSFFFHDNDAEHMHPHPPKKFDPAEALSTIEHCA